MSKNLKKKSNSKNDQTINVEDLPEMSPDSSEKDIVLSVDDGADTIQWMNKLYFFKRFIYEHPGMTYFELARDYKPAEDHKDCLLEEDYEFRKAISWLKFTREVYEDDGFFYVRNRDSLLY